MRRSGWTYKLFVLGAFLSMALMTTPAWAIQNSATGALNSSTLDLTNATVNLNRITGAVDPTQSTVVASPTVVISDGVATSAITITLKDGTGAAVSGKSVTLSTSRGFPVPDILTQPANPTDANGQTTGTIASSTSGITTITATDTTDSITLTQTPTVTFTAGMVLELKKSVNKTQAVIGDILTYTISITNKVAFPVTSVKVIDQLPPGFKYLKGTTLFNGAKVSDPQGHRPLTFDAGVSGGFTVPASPATVTLMYQLVVGSGATPGEYENRAYAFDFAQISNEDRAKVKITLDPIFDLGTIIGKVFHDRNGNGVQDPGEEGVPNAMVALDDGSYVLTDEDGKYHFPAVQPGERLMKINRTTLPAGAGLTTEESRVVQITPGLLAKLNFGVDYRLDEERIGAPAGEGLQLNPINQSQPTKIVGTVVNMETLINGTAIPLPLSEVKLEVQELVEILELKGDRLKAPAVFKPSFTRAEEIISWSLVVTDSKERLVKLFEGSSRPPEEIRWNGVDELEEIVKGGEVYQYQMTLKYRDGSRAISSRRLFGVNKASIVSLSLQGSAFESGKAILNPKTKEVLAKVAEIMRQYPKEKILIEGHTDYIGDAQYNMKLSLDRANSAKEYLVNEERIAEDRLIVKAYGKRRPVASNLLEEGRELNRRVEIKGEVKEVQAGKILDQVRTTPNVLINQDSVPVDEQGRFETQLGPEIQQVQISMLNQQGRFFEATLPLPTLTILEPQTGQLLAYGERNEKYQVVEKNLVNRAEPMVRYRLQGKTEPNNAVTVDGKPLAVTQDGLFTMEVPLHLGKNVFGIVTVSPLSATRIVNEIIDLSDTGPDGKLIIAVKPIPQLTVQLPPKGMVIPRKEIVVRGKTLPENRVQVNGTEVKLNRDGSFLENVELPTGKSVLSIVVTDPEGNQGRISRELVVDTNQIFFMALADAEVGLLKAKGNLENANVEKGFYTEGRLAYYLKGTVLGKYLITSAMDTGKKKFSQIFKDLNKADNDRLLTNLDPDKFYPVYGDNSQVVYDAQSQGRFFLAIDSDELHAIFGNYQTGLNDTELAAYNRTLFGGRVSYQSVSKTQYEAPNTRVVLFGAQVRQAHAHDELRGTGGSLYYLSQAEIIEGSEQVRIEVRDKDTSRILATIPQRQNGDYTIKYDEARILFTQPVHSVVEAGSIVDNALLSGHSVYILVDYEYRISSLDKTAYGGRVRQQVGDHLAVGGTYIKDEQSGGSYVLKGADVETRLGKGTRILAEYAESSGVDSNNHVSYDGGLTYTSTNAVSITPAEGKAYKIEIQSDVGEWFNKKDWLKVGAYYKKLDAGFASNGTVLEQGTQKYGVEMRYNATPADHLLARYDVQELLGGGNAASAAQTGGSRIKLGTLQAIHQQGNWIITGEYQHRSVEQIGQETTTDTFAAKAQLKINERWAASLEQQVALQGEGITQTSIGLDYRLDKSFATQLRAIVGSEGSGLLLGAMAQLDDKSRLYAKQGVMVKEGVGAATQTVVGGEKQITEATRTYGEYRLENAVGDATEAAVLGIANQWRFLNRWRFTLDYERGWLAQVIKHTTRDVLSIGVGYLDPEFIKALSRFEIRREKADVTKMQYLFTNLMELKLNRDFTLLGKFYWSETRNQTTAATEAALTEASVGLAYRPVAFDRFNLLAKATKIRDQRPIGLTNNLPSLTQKDIVSLEGAYDLTSRFQLVEKIALKIKEETVPGLPTTHSQTTLWINRLNYHVTHKWDIGLEYRILKQFQAHDQRQGFLIELDREILDHLRIGVGINFTDFTDSEFSDNNYSTQRYFIRIQGKY